MNREPESESGDVVGMPEVDFERLLRTAYDVPPVPDSLLKRLDAAVTAQWGESPQVARAEPNWLISMSSRMARSWQTWPVAASLVFLLALTVAYSGHAQSYSFTEVVGALAKQAIIHIEGTGTGESETAWLSISQQKIGQQSATRQRLFDLSQKVVLERGASDTKAKRLKLNDVSAAPSQQQLAIGFLLNALKVDSSRLDLPDLKVVKETSKKVGKHVELRVTLQSSPSAEAIKLTLLLDPDSKLPHRVAIDEKGQPSREMMMSYPRASAETLVARAFPSRMPIVDVASSDSTVASTNTAAAPGPNTRDTNNVPANAPQVAVETDAVNQALKVGAASLGWDPVGESKLPSDQAAAEVNSLLERLWRENKVEPVPAASDAELLRRVYLDLAGRTPTVTEVRNYLEDSSPDRYVKLVDRLLASRDHATHIASVWRTFLLPEGVDLSRFGGIPAFDSWLAGRFEKNVPYDQLVRELLLAEGRLSQSGPLLFYSAAKLDADQLAARTARVFLGMRLECAQCHDDPFEPWTQKDFWSYAAFFAQISRPQAALETVSTVMQVRDVNRGEVMMPDSKDPVAPRFLDGSEVDDSPEAEARRKQLAKWMTAADNPYFARAAVNRVWAHLFGRGIVDPVDGFGKANPPRSPELLDLLAAQLVGTQFNLRETFRTIALTRAYQLSSGAESEDPKRQEWFAQMNVKMLTAEQIYDCITVASMLVPTDSGDFTITRVGNTSRDEFLQQFKTLAGRPTEYQGGIPQALTLMNGSLIRSATELAESGLIKSLEAPFFTDDQRIEVIYLATLSRQPTPAEWTVLREYVQGREAGQSIQEPLADILWALLNSAEFTMNH